MLGSVQQMLSCVYSMNVCVCLLKIWLCVPNENTSSILWTVKRFDGKESSCKGSVRFSILCVRFSVFCVQFWESRYCFEKRVLTIVKNCKHISVQWLLRNVYSYDGLCVSFEHKIPFWGDITLFWRQSSILQEICRVLHFVCVVFGFVFRVLRKWGMLSKNVCKQLRKTVKVHHLSI